MSESTPGIPSSGAQIGIDQWVEQADQRIERPGGLAGRLASSWGRIPAAGKLALLTPAILVPFLPFISEGNLYEHHWDAQWSILVAVLICGALGLFLGSSSRRLLGDYLAIVTLFFGQA